MPGREKLPSKVYWTILTEFHGDDFTIFNEKEK